MTVTLDVVNTPVTGTVAAIAALVLAVSLLASMVLSDFIENGPGTPGAEVLRTGTFFVTIASLFVGLFSWIDYTGHVAQLQQEATDQVALELGIRELAPSTRKDLTEACFEGGEESVALYEWVTADGEAMTGPLTKMAESGGECTYSLSSVS